MPDVNPVVEVLAWIFDSYWRWLGVLVLVAFARGGTLVEWRRHG